MKHYWMNFYARLLQPGQNHMASFMLSTFMVMFLLLATNTTLLAQDKKGAKDRFYWVQLKDKPDQGFSIDRPEEFLSPRAIQRRMRQGIAIEENDLPVNKKYVNAVAQKGARIWLKSKWLNGMTVVMDQKTAKKIESLTFVETVFSTGPFNVRPSKAQSYTYDESKVDAATEDQPYYGAAQWEADDLGIAPLHQAGFTGAGQLIAVLDGGFPAVDVHPYLRWPGQEAHIPAYDLVELDDAPYDGGSHGTAVLSSMAARRPGILVGTAPGADYVCIKTESGYGEHRQEEFNWLVGAELADSLGATVINSSLGYTQFDEKDMNYKYEDLDGKKSPASQAATIAAAKGILVVLSAGNEGSGAWRYISTPADGDNLLAVGATDQSGRRAGFSSFGPTADDRMKPEIAAPGVRVACLSPGTLNLRYANGTSLASPLVAGLAASLWEAFPGMSNQRIMEAIRMSGSQADMPDNKLGSGIPNAWKAYLYLQSQRMEPVSKP